MTQNLYSGESNCWAEYQKGRPEVPESFYERIFNYHAEHGGQFGIAHDTGAVAVFIALVLRNDSNEC